MDPELTDWPAPQRFEPVLVRPGEWILWGDVYCGSMEDKDRKMRKGYRLEEEYLGHQTAAKRYLRRLGETREIISADSWAQGFWVLRPVFGYEDNEWGEVGP